MHEFLPPSAPSARQSSWVAARKALGSVVGKDVEDVEQQMRVLLAKRWVEKGMLEDYGVIRKVLVMPKYGELLDKWGSFYSAYGVQASNINESIATSH